MGYLSQETFERERERILLTEWFCAGREEALLAPGHFLKVWNVPYHLLCGRWSVALRWAAATREDHPASHPEQEMS